MTYQHDLFGNLVSSNSLQEASRVPTSASQGGAWESSEEAAVPYGWKCSASFELAIQLSYSLRMYLTSTLAGLTPFSLAWKKRVTPRGRAWWVLGRSERPTDESGLGLSGSEWATPRSNPWGGDRMKRGNLTLLGMAKEWPTPTASDANSSGAVGYPTTDRHHTGTTLTDATVRDWPTPTAQSWKSTKASEATHARNSRPLQEVVGQGMANTDGATVPNQGGSMGREGQPKRPSLDALAQNGRLGEENRNTSGSRPAYLNPDWVEALVGIPTGWTDLPEEIVSALLVTATRPKSRK